MHKSFLKAGAITAALSVALGAFAAHGLKSVVNTEALAIFETAVRYQFYHAFALLLAGILSNYFFGRLIIWAGNLFLAGIIIFCGSLYLLVYFKTVAGSSYNWIGAITPFGGICFIMGWIFLYCSFLKKYDRDMPV